MKSLGTKAKLTREFEDSFREALALRDKEQFDQAVTILQRLVAERPDSASVHGMLGDIYWQQEQLPNAVASFCKATKLSPQSELASLGLFHTLWESGQHDKAKTEMHRFLSQSYSEEYAELARNFLPTEQTKKQQNTMRDYFAKLFQQRPDLLDVNANDAILFLWHQDNPTERDHLADARRVLWAVKSELRKKLDSRSIAE